MKSQISNFKFPIAATMGSAFTRSAWVLMGMLLCIGSCAKEPEQTKAVADGQRRIVSMAPNLTEIVFALGLDDEIVGVTRQCNYPPQALSKPHIGTFWQPDVEAVVAGRPTLVIAEDFAQQRQLTEQLERLGCATLTVKIETIAQLYDGILSVGQAVGRIEQAHALVSRLKAAQDALQADTAERPQPKVLWVIQRQPLRVAGTKTFINEMIEAVGGINAIGPTVNIYPPISAEDVIAAWPDVIIEPANMPDSRQEQARSAGAFYAAFRTVPAVKNKRVFVIDGDLVSRLGPRLDQSLAEIARCLWQD